MRTLSTHLKTSVAALCVAIPGAAFAEAPILVTSSADTGEGSLRAALDAAAASGASSIITLTPGNNIELASGLIYSGTDALAIHGNDTRITSGANVTLLTASEGANLTLTDLTLQGSGGFDINNRGDIDETAGKGIFVDVRDDQTGLVTLRLSDVTVANVAGHGVHIPDCSLADDCGGGGGGAGEGSPASISVVFSDVTIDGVGQGRFDADGLRVNARLAAFTLLRRVLPSLAQARFWQPSPAPRFPTTTTKVSTSTRKVPAALNWRSSTASHAATPTWSALVA